MTARSLMRIRAGTFLTYLKKKKWYDGALIILVGDHGEAWANMGGHARNFPVRLHDACAFAPEIAEEKRRVESSVIRCKRSTSCPPYWICWLSEPRQGWMELHYAT
jgi:arylsulfatase A-like enzyme